MSYSFSFICLCVIVDIFDSFIQSYFVFCLLSIYFECIFLIFCFIFYWLRFLLIFSYLYGVENVIFHVSFFRDYSEIFHMPKKKPKYISKMINISILFLNNNKSLECFVWLFPRILALQFLSCLLIIMLSLQIYCYCCCFIPPILIYILLYFYIFVYFLWLYFPIFHLIILGNFWCCLKIIWFFSSLLLIA